MSKKVVPIVEAKIIKDDSTSAAKAVSIPRARRVNSLDEAVLNQLSGELPARFGTGVGNLSNLLASNRVIPLGFDRNSTEYEMNLLDNPEDRRRIQDARRDYENASAAAFGEVNRDEVDRQVRNYTRALINEREQEANRGECCFMS